MKINKRDSKWLDICIKINPNISYCLKDKSEKDRRKIFFNYLNKLERVSYSLSDKNYKKFSSIYYKNYVIKKENIKDSVINNIRIRSLYSNGFTGEPELIIDNIIKNQEKSLDNIIKFLLNKKYTIFEKYFVFQGLVRLKEDRNRNELFVNRDKNTVAPFISINEKAIDYVVNMINNYIDNNYISDVRIKSSLKDGNFKSLYNYAVNEIRNNNIKGIDGIWKKYSQGEDYKELFKDLENKYTGWCTEKNELTCKNQISSGDFYVYYTRSVFNTYTVPRIAIRMEDNNIYEIRGILKDQEVEPELLSALKSKLNELPFSEKSMKKFHDMKLLDKIYKKNKENKELSINELKYIYQIDEPIFSFGYINNPKIDEIIESRDMKKDLSIIYNIDKDNIKSNISYINNETVIYIGDLDIDKVDDIDNINGIKYVFGNIESKGKSIKLPSLELVIGSLNLSNAHELKARKLKRINDYCNLMNLRDASDLISLEYIGKDASFSSLYESYGLDNLKYVMGDLDFSELVDARNLKKLVEINGEANFYNLGSSTGLNSLKYINGRAIFSSLTSASSLSNLTYINGSAHFENLMSSYGLKNLVYIFDSAYFNSLIYPVFPSLKNIYGSGIFPKIESYSFIDNLDYVGSDLILKKVLEPELKDYPKKELKLIFE